MDAESQVSRLFEAINTHDIAGAEAVLAPDFVFEEVAGPGDPSRAAFADEMRMIFEGFPDIVFRPVRVSEGDGRIYAEFRALGTHRGAFVGVQPTGMGAMVSGVFNVEVAGDTIRRLRLTIDFGSLRRQLLMAARQQ